MPIYEYECTKCGKRYEHLHASEATRDDAPDCPECGGAEAKRVFSVFSVNHSPSFGGGRTCCGSDDPQNVGCGTPGACCSGGK
ncbi:MAG: zinc ribbon domain-containing protein [Deltaproteobacteria bacterium]|nr:zinc ribbon domain-containing protein [Deltaproteobacteria bacterium]